MHLAFWSLYLICETLLLIVTLPLLIELLILTSFSLLRPRQSSAHGSTGHDRAEKEDPGSLLRLAVIVPAHDEERLIERCVHSLVAHQPPAVQIFVVAHNCTDQTAEKGQKAGAKILVIDNPSVRGKAAALREGFDHALRQGAEACVVVDADSVVSTNFLRTVQKALGEGEDAVQAIYKVLPQQHSEKLALSSIAFLGFNVVRPRGRERLGLSVGIFGNGFGFRRKLLEEVPYHANSVVEDLEYHVDLVAAHKRVRLLEDATVFGEMPQTSSGSATQRARWEGGRLLMMRRLPLRLLACIVRGDGRLLEPLLDVLSIPIAMGVSCLLLLLLSPLGWMRLYAVAGLVTISFHFLVAVQAGQDFWGGLRMLLRVPGYLLWKMMLLPKILMASRPDAAWIRTGREATEFPSHPPADALE